MYTSKVVHSDYCGKRVVAPLATINVHGDGNCFFRALSVALTSDEEAHKELRKLVIGELKKRFEVYRKYMDNPNVDQASYIEEMAKSGTWAMAAEIYATASRLDIGKSVYAVDVARAPQWLLTAPVDKSDDQIINYVYLQLHNKHYTCVSDFALE